MLTWQCADVPSPYGLVATLHWAVSDEEAEADDDNPKFRPLDCARDQLGSVLWNSNRVALEYLHNHVFRCAAAQRRRGGEATPLAGMRVVELGAGVGCLGIALAMAGAVTLITDIKELVPLMAHNIALNSAAIAQRSGGVGKCTAMEWKWGPEPPARPGLGAHSKARAKDRAGGSDTDGVKGTTPPPTRFATAMSILGGTVDYVVLCDALYGNPKDWRKLIFTLTELLSLNPKCEIFNFCEQRVDNVEGGFLAVLLEEIVYAGDDGVELPAPAGTKWKWAASTTVVEGTGSDLGMVVKVTKITVVPVRSGTAGDEGGTAAAAVAEAPPPNLRPALEPASGPRKRERDPNDACRGSSKPRRG